MAGEVKMTNRWRVIYYETKNGECPVIKFIDSKTKRNQAKILSLISLLEEKGPTLPRPYSDILSDGIHELRIKLSGNQVRVLYFFCFREFIVLTHAFTKTTARVPIKEIKKAQKYREDFLDRVTENDIKEVLNEDF